MDGSQHRSNTPHGSRKHYKLVLEPLANTYNCHTKRSNSQITAISYNYIPILQNIHTFMMCKTNLFSEARTDKSSH